MPRANANGGKAADADEDQGGEDVQEDDTTDARQPTLQLGAALFLKAATAMSTALVAGKRSDGPCFVEADECLSTQRARRR
jgi:hypothetical protein